MSAIYQPTTVVHEVGHLLVLWSRGGRALVASAVRAADGSEGVVRFDDVPRAAWLDVYVAGVAAEAAAGLGRFGDLWHLASATLGDWVDAHREARETFRATGRAAEALCLERGRLVEVELQRQRPVAAIVEAALARHGWLDASALEILRRACGVGELACSGS